MAITRLKRKGRKNKLKSKIRAQKFKVEGFAPVIRNVDVEAIKEEFKAAAKKPKAVASSAKGEKVEVAAPVEKAAKSAAKAAPAKAVEKTVAKTKAATPAAKEEKAKPAAKKKAPAAKKKAPAAKKKAPAKAKTAAAKKE